MTSEATVYRIYNPADTRELVTEVLPTAPAALPDVLERARRAQREWALVPTVQRSTQLMRFLDDVEAAAEEIAVSITREQGKPLREARGEVLKSVSEGRAMASHALSAGAIAVACAQPHVRNLVVRRPRGVISAITPWNFPILTPMRKIAPAIVYGNAIILKPAEFTPTATIILARLAEAHFPAHLYSVLFGGAELGQALSMAAVEGITFTGSVEVGRKILAGAALNLAEVSLELGGKNAVVVNDVENPDTALDAIVGAAMQCAGQRCTAISRVIVNEEIADSFVEALSDRCASMVIGDGMDESTEIGAITTATQFSKIAQVVELGIKEGAVCRAGGARASIANRPNGRFYAPTVLDHVTPGMRIAVEEVFGPVISVLRYRNFDEALAIANAPAYGLTSALFSNRNDLINRFIDEVRSGMIHINQGTAPQSHMPFGGIGESGFGSYSVGPSAVAFYTTEHAVYNQYN